jgi:hypothetical protein
MVRTLNNARRRASLHAVSVKTAKLDCGSGVSPRLTTGKQREESQTALNLEELAAEAVKLAIEERAQLASSLLLSIEEPSESEVERLRLEEAERRLREFREDRVQGILGGSGVPSGYRRDIVSSQLKRRPSDRKARLGQLKSP